MHVQDVWLKGAYLPPQGQSESGADWGIQKAAVGRHTIDPCSQVPFVGLPSTEFMAMDKSSRVDLSSLQGREQVAHEIFHASCKWRIKLANVQNAHLKTSRIVGPATHPSVWESSGQSGFVFFFMVSISIFKRPNSCVMTLAWSVSLEVINER